MWGSAVTAPALPQGEEKSRVVRDMFDRIAPRYDVMNRLISLGMDAHWRHVAIGRLALPIDSMVVDIACGTGDFCRLLQRAGHRPVGVDYSLGMLQQARTTAPLLQADALQLPFADGSVDGITCGFALRNFVDLPAFFAESARVIRPGGRIVLLDACQPPNRLVALGHRLYFGKVVPLLGRALSDSSAYRYLPDSLAYLPPIAVMLQSLKDAGFDAVMRKTFLGGAAHLITATRR
jgi:demethylmenaquinone methyltransferase/2-methoxy-6-polyprenyl-1,4-benzoquinol methylase